MPRDDGPRTGGSGQGRGQAGFGADRASRTRSGAVKSAGKRKPASRDPRAVADAQRAGRAAFLDRFGVSRETEERLDRYVALLTEWQSRINLIAPATLSVVWERHIADSLQLEQFLPPFQRCADLGSGGGLPGLVIAIQRPGAHVDLVESNGKKAAFLRTVMRELGLSGAVHAERIEAVGPVLSSADVVTARALASLSELLAMVEPHVKPEAKCFFAKGETHGEEIEAASALWRFEMVKHDSILKDGSVVLELGAIERR
ncbi:MAG: 16S rRNA (guanine(527)-N(7))-methyltransferase RsmG [Fulvimarina manganoxydans]|nr:16S rRNA (guanine(527)-N(7))-methyltransferase RsmG [Fulvimarina manganoxydans]